MNEGEDLTESFPSGPEGTSSRESLFRGAPPVGSGGNSPSPSSGPGRLYTAEEGTLMLRIARGAIQHLMVYNTERELPGSCLPGSLLEKRACFVTLFNQGELRGCVGHIYARAPLHAALVEAACGAATRDPRFLPVRREEVEFLRIEISILSEIQPLHTRSTQELLDHLLPGIHGVLLRVEDVTSTFLPQVWEQFQNKEEFLNRLAQKAGCPASAWRSPAAEISVYETQSFEEPSPEIL